ncbi:MAG: hypothetical protein HPY73_02150 [Methanomassiliicoccales archaeon]|nr:MAG: hypothetical protein HPY73_02150 [Methanomassiliicoccales archaeon]
MANTYKGKRRDTNFQRRDLESTRVPMLNLRRIGEFKYDIRELMNGKEMDPAIKQTMIASIIAKASRQSIIEAKNYVKAAQTEGTVTKELSDNICYLLDRYTKYQSQNV